MKSAIYNKKRLRNSTSFQKNVQIATTTFDNVCAGTSVPGILSLCPRVVQACHPRPPVVTAQEYRGRPVGTHWVDDSSTR